MRDRPFDETMIELLRKDSEFAAELLNIAVTENTPEELAIILRQLLAAGYRVSLAPEPKPRKRAKPGAAEEAKGWPTSRGRTRHSAVAVV